MRFDLPDLPVRVELSVAWRFSVSRSDEPVAGVARWYRAFRLVKWGKGMIQSLRLQLKDRSWGIEKPG